MKNIYLEFLTELYISLERTNPSKWSEWMKKSIDKFKENEDISYFLSAFGGMGSFNDFSIKDPVTEELSILTYNCCKILQKSSEEKIIDILIKEQERLTKNINLLEISPNNQYFFNKQEKSIDMLNYVNELINNYTGGNLHEITINYLNTFKSKQYKK